MAGKQTRNVKSKPRVLVLAGLDPSGRAGLVADGEAIVACGGQPILCATAITAQSATRLVLKEAVSEKVLRAQIEAALADGDIGAAKVGMLANRGLLQVALEVFHDALPSTPLVVDPVLETSRGGSLFDGALADYLSLFERADLVTPNLNEAAQFSGMDLSDEILMHEAASRIALQGAKAVLLKGGHLTGSPSDLLLAGGQAHWFRGERIKSKKRGTGCRLASSIAAGLAAGMKLEKSVGQAVELIRNYLKE